MDLVVDPDFEQWQVPALLLDGATRCIVATTKALQELLGAPADAFVGVPLADLLGAEAAAGVCSGYAPAPCRALRRDGRVVHLLARGYPAPSEEQLVALFEDTTDLFLGRATAEAMAGIARAWTPHGDGARGCAEALVLSGLCEKAAILGPPSTPDLPAVLGASGWTSDELSSVLASEATELAAGPATGDVAGRWGGARLLGEGPSASLSTPLADRDGLVGLLLVQPASEWIAAPGTPFLVAAIAEGLREQERARAPRSAAGTDKQLARATTFADTVEALAQRICETEPGQPFQTTFDRFMQALREAVPFDRSALVERALGGEGVYVRADYSPGKTPLLAPGSTYSMEGTASLQAMMTGQVVTHRLADDVRSGAARALVRGGLALAAAAPVACGGAPRGALVLGREAPRGSFEPEELRLLRLAGELLGCLARAARVQGEPRRRRRGESPLSDASQAMEGADLVLQATEGAVAYFGPFAHTTEASLAQAEALVTGPAAASIARLRGALGGLYYVLEALEAYADRAPDDRAERLSLRGLVREVMDEVASRRAEGRGPGLAAYRIEQDLGLEGWVWGRRDRIRAAIAGAVDNALTAMPEGGTMAVHLTRHRRWLRVMISDSGVGIAPPLWDAVFLPFVGTWGLRHPGLGLSVVDGVMAKHGGVALFASDVHEGTTLALYFPDADAG